MGEQQHWLKESKGWQRGEFSTKSGSINRKDRTLEATVSTDSIDRDGEVILPKAFTNRLDTYRKNPVLLWNHNPFEPPIGKALEVTVGETSMDARFQFMSSGKSAIADQVFAAFDEGILTSFSVGFRVFDMQPGEQKSGEQIKPPTITDAELIEISAVTIPANTEALVKRANMVDLLRSAHYRDKAALGEVKMWTPTDLDVLLKAAEIAKARRAKIAAGEWINEQEREAIRALQLSVMGDVRSEDETAVLAALDDVLAVIRS